jgi:Peptidase family M23
MIRIGVFLIAALISGSASADDDVTFAGRLEQGGLVVGTAPPGTTITYNGTNLHLTPDGHFLVGIGRDAPAHIDMKVTTADGKVETKSLAIAKRDWEIERVDGVPQQLVTPDPVLAAKIAGENKLMYAAYMKLELTPFFETGFIRPAEGRISGVFGSQRILNGTPLAPHTGLDIAGGMGGQVHAAADGIVTLAHPMMVMTGNTVVLNHGYGLETIYIHMSKIFVTPGQQVKQGDLIGEIGMTGRANGPHLHFGATWFNTRLDPATLLDVLPAPAK